MDLNGKRALVTGGAGFVGSHIVDLLVAEGCREILSVDTMIRGRPDNLSDAISRGGAAVQSIHGDIRDRELMSELIKNSDVVFHQAALRITHCAEEPRLALEVMVDATFDVLNLCIEHGVEKVVAASRANRGGECAVATSGPPAFPSWYQDLLAGTPKGLGVARCGHQRTSR